MARIGISFIPLLVIFVINLRAPLWMYIQAFHFPFLGKLRVITIVPSLESSKIRSTLRMTNNIDPTQTADIFSNSTTSTDRSLQIYNDAVDEAVAVDHDRAKNGMQRNEYMSSETFIKSISSSTRQQQQQNQQGIRSPKKYHHLSVCMVPPESSLEVWDAITKCRIQFKDPGLYRWPPHANLLYPFIDIRPETSLSEEDNDIHDETFDNSGDNDLDDGSTTMRNTAPVVDASIIEGLLRACRQIEPFHVRLHQFGTFGNSKRGVLWLYPDSYCTAAVDIMNNDDADVVIGCNNKAPLVQLQELLVESFPYCNDQNVKSNEGFNPHMTISHFIDHHGALEAQKQVESWWLQSPPTLDDVEHQKMTLDFPVEYIYLLQRFGDSGQFLRVADIPLGSSSSSMNEAIVHPVPIPFVHMPSNEADWVYQERMKLKQRRNGQWRSRGGGNSSKSRDTTFNDTFMIVDQVMNTTATTNP